MERLTHRSLSLSLSANESFISERIVVVAQSLNSRAYDCFLFWKAKNHCKGYHFGTLDDVRKIVTEQFIFSNKFQHCFQEWKRRFWRCIGCTFSKELVSLREQRTIFVKRRTNVPTELAVLLILTHHVYPVSSPAFGFSLYRVKASRLTNININRDTIHKTRDIKISFGRVFRRRGIWKSPTADWSNNVSHAGEGTTGIRVALGYSASSSRQQEEEMGMRRELNGREIWRKEHCGRWAADEKISSNKFQAVQ